MDPDPVWTCQNPVRVVRAIEVLESPARRCGAFGSARRPHGIQSR